MDWPWWIWLLIALWPLPGMIWSTAHYLRAVRLERECYHAELAREDDTRALRRHLRRMLVIYTLTYLVMLALSPLYPVFLLADRNAKPTRRRRGPRSYRPRIIPVLDLLRGQVVRGVGGRREEYRPILSQLTASHKPLDVAHAFWEHFRLNRLYLADLDAIAGAPPAIATYRVLLAAGFRLWVDAGIRQPDGAKPLAEAGVSGIVAGLETLSGPQALQTLCQEYGAERVIFSLDLKGGQPLTVDGAWQGTDARSIADQAVACGVRRMIVLDLANVGAGGGLGTEVLCEQLARAYPQIEIVAGGGVRGVEDLRRLRECGVRGVLVASALHDGRITRTDLETL